VRGLILDLDDTLVTHGGDRFPETVTAWLRGIQRDFRVCIVSNTSRQRRARSIAAHLDIPVFAQAQKPRREVLRQAMAAMNLGQEEVMVVGDRLLTDILGGIRLGARTALVGPVADNRRLPRLLRRLERGLLNWLHRRAAAPTVLKP